MGDHKKPDENGKLKTFPVANGSAFSRSDACEIFIVIIDDIIKNKTLQIYVTSSEEMIRTILRIKDMVLHKGWKNNDEENYEKMRKIIEENTDSDPPVILITTDGVAFHPSLSR